MLLQLSDLTPEEIIELFGELFGKNIEDKLNNLFNSGGSFSFILDEETLTKLDKQLNEITEEMLIDPFELEREPYYEITQPYENKGEIIIYMPGIRSIKYINWYEVDRELYIYTTDHLENYRLIMPIPQYFVIDEPNIKYLHGLFVIPYKLKK